MSTTDNLTDINWPSSFYSLDESWVESSHNPYHTEPHPNTTTTRDTNNNTCPAPTMITLSGQQAITRWLTSTAPNDTSQTTTPTTCLPTIKLKQIWCKQSHIQVPLHKLLTNNHWGDLPSSDPVIFRVLSKNVNSLSTKYHNLQWRGMIQAMIDLNAHVICLQEPNTNWTDNLIIKKTPQLLKCYLSMSLDVRRRPTLVWLLLFQVTGGRGFCGFLVASVIYLVQGYCLGGIRCDRCQHGLSCSDITSGLPDDVIIDVNILGHGQTVTSRLPYDVMGYDVTSGWLSTYLRGVEPLCLPQSALL